VTTTEESSHEEFRNILKATIQKNVFVITTSNIK